MTPALARLEIPPQPAFLEPTVGFVLAFAARFARGESEQSELKTAVSAVLEMVIDNNAGGGVPVAVEVGETAGKLRVSVINHGAPILLRGGRTGIHSRHYAKFHEASRHADSVTFENSGRQGQAVVLELRLGAVAAAMSLLAKPAPQAPAIPEDEVITVRGLAPGEEDALSRLFYLVYGYDYVNEFVYYPEKIKDMLEAGDLLSIVAARPNGRLVGHVALVRRNREPAVYEAAMGAVDPAVKSRGLFGQLFGKAMEVVRSTPMQYCLCDCVTNHAFSQRHVAKFGGTELALYAGCQSRETQARLERLGLGKDPESMLRYSLLVSVIPRVPRPFGAGVVLPESIGERFGFLLEPLGLAWSPAPRFQSLPAAGSFKTSTQRAQSAALFDLSEPGQEAVEDIVEEWRELLREGFEYAAVEVPLDAPGLGPLYDILSGGGFFASGFVPYRCGAPAVSEVPPVPAGRTSLRPARLGFRFQALGPTKVAFDDIKVATDHGKRLLAAVRKDYEANGLL
ncbi:MAG: hypothetical protein PHU21_07395 [Elusimicrobia bacterium]|nr:hypothetical protein [Elusimicrobiota bacterium]